MLHGRIQIILNFAFPSYNSKIPFKMRIIRRSAFVALISLISIPAFSQIMIDTSIRWKSVREVMELSKTEPRPTMVLFYKPGDDTSNMLIQTVLNKKEIIMYANPRFYCVKINAEDTAVYWFNQKTYRRTTNSANNDIIAQLLGEKASFPTLLFFNEQNTGAMFKGFRSRYEMRCLLVYFAEGVDKTTPYNLWLQAYNVAYPPLNMPKNLENPIHWISLKEALKLQKTSPRLIFITWTAHLNVGSTVMTYNAFEDPRVARYMNDHFYCVKLDAQTNDTLVMGKVYVNGHKPDRYHQLATAQLEGKMIFPSLLFLDTEKKVVVKQQSYLGPLNFFALANYAGSGAYKTQTLHEFRKSFKPDF